MLDLLHPLWHNINVILDSFNLHQIVTDATHYSTQGACVPSLLDLILVSDLNLVRFQSCSSLHFKFRPQCGILLSQSTIIKHLSKEIYESKNISGVFLQLIGVGLLVGIQETDWDQLISDCDIDSAWNAWKSA